MNFERLHIRAASIDELLSDDFAILVGQKGDADLATRRLAAWCRACASGDWVQFSRRLQRDRLSFDQVLAKFATVRRNPSATTPRWLSDASWIAPALAATPAVAGAGWLSATESCAFEHLFIELVEQADRRMWANLGPRTGANLTSAARAGLMRLLLWQLSELCAPMLYERFVDSMNGAVSEEVSSYSQSQGGASHYSQFISEMNETGLERMFEEKPVMLRLIATITRQWTDATTEFLLRMDADMPAICRDLLGSTTERRVVAIEGGLSDPHNGGRSVLVVTFDNARRVLYKPKDVRLDLSWYKLIDRLNRANPPVDLKAVMTLSRDGYGWTEFIEHTECVNQAALAHFYRRAGAWLALFYVFVGTDMHEENMIASGDHPVPIDLEMILQPSNPEFRSDAPEEQAIQLAWARVTESVMMIGLLPSYARTPANEIYDLGGLNNERRVEIAVTWDNVNTDAMRISRRRSVDAKLHNVPRFDAERARLGDHVDDLIAGFEAYARFLVRLRDDPTGDELLGDFVGLPVRKVIRPTRFYYLLLRRLKDHRNMVDGGIWSAQADFVARLANWAKDCDPIWPLHHKERLALLDLNVPHFMTPGDADVTFNATSLSTRTLPTTGVDRARNRFNSLNEDEIAWQSEVIRLSTSWVATSSERVAQSRCVTKFELSAPQLATGPSAFLTEAERICAFISDLAILSGPSAAWIGLDWLGDSSVGRLAPLGDDLYNGTPGVAIFLAALARMTGHKAASELALAGVAGLRKRLRSPNAARMARYLGIGGCTGLGSIVYAFAVIAKLLDDAALLSDAYAAAELISEDLVAADGALDAIGGSAGAILGLLRLYRQTGEGSVLERAIMCGEHLLRQRRMRASGQGSCIGQGARRQALTGMSHGAAGFAYSLVSLSAATARADFGDAALECIALENRSYDPARRNWPDYRDGADPAWPCQWCHGATGIGISRAATLRLDVLDANLLRADVEHALHCADQCWPHGDDTLCCGALGSIEFLDEASSALQRPDLRDLAGRRMSMVLGSATAAGDYRFGAGGGKLNLGLFRGLAGVGYTLLRRTDRTLPNVTIWE